jgi:hypothetical protein
VARLRKNGKTVPITAVQKIEILELLASKKKRKDIADKYHTSEKAISRVRDQALTYSSIMKSSLSKEVQQYLILYKELRPKKAEGLPQMDQIQNIDEHFEDLAKCAKELADILEDFKDPAANYTLHESMESLIEEGDFDTIEFFYKKITGCLFAHLKQSELVSGLERLDDWGDLEVSKIDDHFIKMIRLEAAIRGFNGICGLCRAKPGSNRKVT